MAALFSCLASAQLYRQLEYVPGLTYTALALLLLLPANVLARSSRLLFARTSGRVLVPLQDVSWADFLLADMLTSLAKSCMDLERSLCHMATGERATPGSRRLGAAAREPPPRLGAAAWEPPPAERDRDAAQRLGRASPGGCGADAADAAAAAAAAGPMLLALPFVPHDEVETCNPIALPAMAALCTPYLIRFVQCLHVHRATGATPQLFNALKYLSAFPALALTIAEHEHHVRGEPFPWRTSWLLASAFNSLFSYYWDVEQVGGALRRGAGLDSWRCCWRWR
jgi:hypothetical protein